MVFSDTVKKLQDQKHDMEREIKTLHRRLRVGTRARRPVGKRGAPKAAPAACAQPRRGRDPEPPGCGQGGAPLREGLAPGLTSGAWGAGVISREETS